MAYNNIGTVFAQIVLVVEGADYIFIFTISPVVDHAGRPTLQPQMGKIIRILK